MSQVGFPRKAQRVTSISSFLPFSLPVSSSLPPGVWVTTIPLDLFSSNIYGAWTWVSESITPWETQVAKRNMQSGEEKGFWCREIWPLGSH